MNDRAAVNKTRCCDLPVYMLLIFYLKKVAFILLTLKNRIWFCKTHRDISIYDKWFAADLILHIMLIPKAKEYLLICLGQLAGADIIMTATDGTN